MTIRFTISHVCVLLPSLSYSFAWICNHSIENYAFIFYVLFCFFHLGVCEMWMIFSKICFLSSHNIYKTLTFYNQFVYEFNNTFTAADEQQGIHLHICNLCVVKFDSKHFLAVTMPTSVFNGKLFFTWW